MRRITDNILKIRERIHGFEQSYQRRPESVKLLAVSKKQPVALIREAFQAGVRDFGENYLQEAEDKLSALSDLDITWHFIGPLQSNKTRTIAARFHWVHSVDRLKIARRLSEQRQSLPPLNLCVQVNLSGEQSKSGVEFDAAEELCQQIADLPNLALRGLMSIPAPETEFTRQRAQFRKLAALYFDLQRSFPQFDTLSMGMSNDYEAAIAEGSTLVRVGTAVFGPRI